MHQDTGFPSEADRFRSGARSPKGCVVGAVKFPNAQVLERVYYFEGCCLLGVVPGQVLSGDGSSVA